MTLIFYKLKIPLKKPYKLSLGLFNCFDTIILLLHGNKKTAYGECTALPGYSWESPEEIWSRIKSWTLSSNNSLNNLVKLVKKDLKSHPFASTPILTAIESAMLSFDNVIKPIPLTAVMLADTLHEIEEELSSFLSLGYKTIKVKFTGNVKSDIGKINHVQNILKNKALIRIDANQGYTFEGMKSLFNQLNPEGIELFEQPFKPQEWDKMQTLSNISPIPLMLDESIWTEDDIIKTAKLACATYVKLKLVKHSSIQKTIRLVKLAKDLGLKVIFGNGFQSDIGCLNEALIYELSEITTDAEFNGFLKQRKSLFKNPILMKNNMFSISGLPDIDDAIIQEYYVDNYTIEIHNDLDENIMEI